MSKTLFLFLFSPNPDSYINAICYAYEKLDVKKVKLIHVKGAKTALSDKDAPLVKNRIWSQIEGLSKGEYIVFPKDLTALDRSQKQLNNATRIDVYRRIQEDFLDDGVVDIHYDKLKEGLDSVFRKYGGTKPKNYVVDLTSGAKAPTIDIFSVCLALGVDQIYIFELADTPDRANPENSLYHALPADKFSYTCLTKSAAVMAGRAAFLRKRSLRWAVMLISLVVWATSTAFFLSQGSNSQPLQYIMVLSGIVGLVSPIVSSVSERRA
ncbi:MAG: hypothetical protein JNJ61_05750 [Anaerolineae bacterium]|nr:hypothetical protein [Anaerolineae bacterium]